MIAPTKRAYRRKQSDEFKNCTECGGAQWTYRRLTRVISMTCVECGHVCRRGDPLAPNAEQIAAGCREVQETRKALGVW